MLPVFLDDLVDVMLVDIGVPDFFRVHHDAGAFLAAVEATRLVDARVAFPGEPEFLHALLGVVAQRTRALVVAADPAALALVAAEENVVGVITHAGFNRRDDSSVACRSSAVRSNERLI